MQDVCTSWFDWSGLAELSAMCPLPCTVAKDRPCSWALLAGPKESFSLVASCRSSSCPRPLSSPPWRVVDHLATELGPSRLQLQVRAEEVGLPQHQAIMSGQVRKPSSYHMAAQRLFQSLKRGCRLIVEPRPIVASGTMLQGANSRRPQGLGAPPPGMTAKPTFSMAVRVPS